MFYRFVFPLSCTQFGGKKKRESKTKPPAYPQRQPSSAEDEDPHAEFEKDLQEKLTESEVKAAFDRMLVSNLQSGSGFRIVCKSQ